jgi:hypothetical protein
VATIGEDTLDRWSDAVAARVATWSSISERH